MIIAIIANTEGGAHLTDLTFSRRWRF